MEDEGFYLEILIIGYTLVILDRAVLARLSRLVCEGFARIVPFINCLPIPPRCGREVSVSTPGELYPPLFI